MASGRIFRPDLRIRLDEWYRVIEKLDCLYAVPQRKSKNPFTGMEVVFGAPGSAHYMDNEQIIGEVSFVDGQLQANTVPESVCRQIAGLLEAEFAEDARSASSTSARRWRGLVMNRKVDVAAGETGDGQINVMIQTPECELHVFLSGEEYARLPQVRNARWTTRESLQLGTMAGSPVFWSCEDGRLNILAGQDDEAWDIAVVLPISVLDEILRV